MASSKARTLVVGKLRTFAAWQASISEELVCSLFATRIIDRLAVQPLGNKDGTARLNTVQHSWAQDAGVREIARRIGRSPSTVSRELRRNAATRGGKLEYRPSVAQWKAELVARRPKAVKLLTNPQLREYVQDRLAGKIHDADGREIAGPGQVATSPIAVTRQWVNGWLHARRTDPRWPAMEPSQQALRRALKTTMPGHSP